MNYNVDGTIEESNEKIMIFALHEDSLYNFTLMNEA